MEDPYIILQIPRSASPARIKEAYRAQIKRHRAAATARDPKRREPALQEMARIEQAYATLLGSPESTEPPVRSEFGRNWFSLAHLALVLIAAILGLAAFLVFRSEQKLNGPSLSQDQRWSPAALASLTDQEIPVASGSNSMRQAVESLSAPTGFDLERVVPNETVSANTDARPLPESAVDRVSFEFHNTGDRVEGELVNESDWAITEVHVEFSREYWDGESLLDSDRREVPLQLNRTPIHPGERVAFFYDVTDHLEPRSFTGSAIVPAMNPMEVSIQGRRNSLD